MHIQVNGVLDAAAVARIRAALAQANFVDGKATAGPAAAPRKQNQQATKATNPALAEHQQAIEAALMRNEAFRTWAMPARLAAPMFNRYEPGMFYGDHVDNAIMGAGPTTLRTDMSVTVFLSEPGEYDGGELVINSDLSGQAVKLPAGSAIVYPSDTIHRVQPVTRGVRLAAVTWVQSMIRDERQRALLAELSGLARWARNVAPESREAIQLGKVRANLMRMWSDV